MQLVINGHHKEVQNALSIADIVSQFSKNNSRIIVELNGAIINANCWDTTSLHEGDILELIAFVGGG